MVSTEHREVAILDAASTNTQTRLIHWSSFAGRGKEGFTEYKSKVRVYVKLYSKAVFDVFQGKDQPSYILSIEDIAMLNIVVSERGHR